MHQLISIDIEGKQEWLRKSRYAHYKVNLPAIVEGSITKQCSLKSLTGRHSVAQAKCECLYNGSSKGNISAESDSELIQCYQFQNTLTNDSLGLVNIRFSKARGSIGNYSVNILSRWAY
jgi:hypothetical protein